LEVKKFGGMHSGEHISQMINQVMDDWNLDRDRLTFMLRDNAANGALACRLSSLPSFGCIPHSMHLVLSPLLFPKKSIKDAYYTDQDTLLSCDSVIAFEESLNMTDKEVVQKLSAEVKTLRSLAKYFCKSPKGLEKLMNMRSADAKQVKPIVDIVTRWSSTCMMLERLISLKSAIDDFILYVYSQPGKHEFRDFKKKKPKVQEWFIVECLVKLLTPFQAARTLLSGDSYGTMVLAFPALRLIKKT
jgi:hypothetical protein